MPTHSCAPLVAAGCIVSPIVATFATVGHNENMKKNNNKDRELRKIRAFELLSSGETVSSVAEKTGFNKGSISRWRRSAAFALWQGSKDAAQVLPPTKNEPLGVSEKVRSRFIYSLRLTGRLDVACAYSGAPVETVTRWLAENADIEIIQAHAEPFMRTAQIIRNLMEGRNAAGQPVDIRPSDQLKAAERYLALMDWRKDVPHLRVDINAGSAAISLDDGGAKTPLSLMIESMKQEFVDIAEAHVVTNE